jgi:hypothetical protein
MNRQWHQAHVLGQHARLEERLAWHEEHARLCHCRDMPESIARELAARAAAAAVPGSSGAEDPAADGRE